MRTEDEGRKEGEEDEGGKKVKKEGTFETTMLLSRSTTYLEGRKERIKDIKEGRKDIKGKEGRIIKQ